MGDVNFPENARAIVVKGGKSPVVEIIVGDKLQGVGASVRFLNEHLMETQPMRDEALKGLEVKKLRFAQGQETNEIYFELYKDDKLVGTGENSGRGEENNLGIYDPVIRKELDAFVDFAAQKYPDRHRHFIKEDLVLYFALYFNSGFCDFNEFLSFNG